MKRIFQVVIMIAIAGVLSGCSRENKLKDIYITVESNSAYKLNGKTYDSEAIGKELEAIVSRKGHKLAIQFTCDPNQPFSVLDAAIEPASRLGVFRFTLKTDADSPPADCSRPCPDPSGGRVYNYLVRVYPNRCSVNGTDATLPEICKTMQTTGNNYVTVIPKKDVKIGSMYEALRACETNAKVLGVGWDD